VKFIKFKKPQDAMHGSAMMSQRASQHLFAMSQHSSLAQALGIPWTFLHCKAQRRAFVTARLGATWTHLSRTAASLHSGAHNDI
jgi:hypothetical protein